MAAANDQEALSGGTLYADGTALGIVHALAVEHVGFVDAIVAEEFGGETWDMVHRREEVVLAAVITPDDDAMAAAFPNAASGLLRVPATDAGDHTYGAFSSDKAVKLEHYRRGGAGTLTVYNALPLMRPTRIPRNDQEPELIEAAWLGVRDASNRVLRIDDQTPNAMSIVNGGGTGATVLAWWDGSDSNSITSDANGISQWNDKSGNGHHATQDTDANKPNVGAAAVNGLDAVLFDDANQEFLGLAAPIAAAGFRVFAVVQFDDVNGGGGSDPFAVVFSLQQEADSGERFELAGNANAPGDKVTWQARNNANGVATSTGAFTINQALILHAAEMSTTSRLISLDGAADDTDTTDVTPSGIDILTLGRNRGTPAAAMSGYICEVVLVDISGGDMTAANIDALEAHLATKWGITL